MYVTSPTKGEITFEEMSTSIKSFLLEDPQARYKVVIGSDSETSQQATIFVTALIIYRVEKGAQFYYQKHKSKPILNLKTRIFKETELSLALIEYLKKEGISNLFIDWPVEVHVDIGKQGETRKLIQDVVGWVTSVGYDVKIKPYSYGASSVADRFTS